MQTVKALDTSVFHPHDISIGCSWCPPIIRDVYKDNIEVTSLLNDLIKGIKEGKYDIIILKEYDLGDLTTEQMNTIVQYVKNGGGLIIIDDYSNYFESSVVKIFMEKLGITVEKEDYPDFEGTVVEVNETLRELYPILASVEYLYRSSGGRYIQKLSGAIVVLDKPSVIVIKEFENGRIAILPIWVFSDKLSNPKLIFNTVEWVAGYTPEGYTPDITSLVAKYREMAKQCDQSEIQALKMKYSSLEEEHKKLQEQYQNLLQEYKSLQEKYNELKSSCKQGGAQTETVTSTVTKTMTITHTERVGGSCEEIGQKYNDLKEKYYKLLEDYHNLERECKSGSTQTSVAGSGISSICGPASILFGILGPSS